MSEQYLSIGGIHVPRFFYGTAWKEDRTQRLTELALQQGFRGIDTANQRRHYNEAAVGQGIAASIAAGVVSRNDLFLQTKFTFQRSQDHRLPYDPKAPIAKQVAASFDSSCEHLRTDQIDSYVLHGPTRAAGLVKADWEAWAAMEALHESGRTRFLGVSNVTLEQLESLCQGARVQPCFVQNRCYAITAWDRQVRQFCAANNIVYQGFSLLTANAQVLARSAISRIAERHGCSVSQIVFRFALDVGMIALTGTSDAEHMRADLNVFDFQLDPQEIATIEQLAVANR